MAEGTLQLWSEKAGKLAAERVVSEAAARGFLERDERDERQEKQRRKVILVGSHTCISLCI
jgi:hypothetical protein